VEGRDPDGATKTWLLTAFKPDELVEFTGAGTVGRAAPPTCSTRLQNPPAGRIVSIRESALNTMSLDVGGREDARHPSIGN